MIKEAVLLTVSCVLFVQMGLSHAIQETVGFRSRILSCPRCCTFWTVLSYMLLTRHGTLLSVAASFLSSYSATWLALIYDALARFYNTCYEAISQTDDASTDAEASDEDSASTATDEVSQL